MGSAAISDSEALAWATHTLVAHDGADPISRLRCGATIVQAFSGKAGLQRFKDTILDMGGLVALMTAGQSVSQTLRAAAGMYQSALEELKETSGEELAEQIEATILQGARGNGDN